MEGYETGEYSDKIQEKFRQIFDPDTEFIFTQEDAEDMRINSSVSDYVWLPIMFENGKVLIQWMDEWRIEDFD